MPASASNPGFVIKHLIAAFALVWITGCAGHAFAPPSAPDDSVLAPAEKALAKARAAEADTFAPRAVDASRRRIATARDILFDAARSQRELTAEEQDRIDKLIAAARLDARSALVQTQAGAVQTKLAELQGQLDGSGRAQPGVSP
jgi:hypothetical protein